MEPRSRATDNRDRTPLGEPGVSRAGWELLLERDRERALIDAALTGSQLNHGRFVLLYGPAGVGRSSLLRAAALDAGARGTSVLEATGSDLEQGYGFGIVRQLLEAPIAALTSAQRRSMFAHAGPAAEAALGVVGAEPASNAGFDQIEGVHRLIAGLAALAPLLICVDDIQWCDRPSLDFLCFLGHRTLQMPVALIAAWRRGEPGVRAGRLQALAGRPETLFLTPAPLSHEGVAVLLRRATGSEPDDEAVAAVHDQTGGQPFLVSELADGVRMRRLSPKAGSENAIRAITPESVRRNTVARLGRHSETVRRLAQAAAVLGEGSLGNAAELAMIDETKARAAADALTRAGLFRDDSTVAYAQPLLRAAMYDSLSSLERAELHHRAAAMLCDALGSDPAGVDCVAEHILRSEPAGDPRFGAVLRESAVRAAEEGAPDQAQRLLERALGDVEESSSRLELLIQLVEFELRTGNADSAAAHASEALTLPSNPSERATATVAYAQAVAATEGWVPAVELLETEIGCRRGTEPELRLAMQAAAATLRVCANAPPREPSDATSGVDGLAGKTGAERAMLAACASDMVMIGAGSAKHVTDLCARALSARGRREASDEAEVAEYLAARAGLLADAWDLVDGMVAQCPAQPYVRSLNNRELSRLAVRAQLALARGELLDAATNARAALRLLGKRLATALHRRMRGDLLACLAATEIERGRPDEAEQALLQLGEIGPEPHPALNALQIALSLERSEPARALSEEAAVGSTGVLAPGVSWRSWAAIAHLAAGDRAGALAIADDHLARARAWDAPSMLGRALVVRGIADRGAARVELMAEAVAVLEPSAARLELARAMIELGAALRRAGRRRDAREQLVRGADLAYCCGAEPLAAQARAELVGLGARPRRAAFSGIGSLTVSELRVARLAAAGMTNREIANELTVSVKTVSGQLTAVYRKLDVHDRSALTAAMQAEQEPVA